MHLVSAQFDANRAIDEYMDVAAWNDCQQRLQRVIQLLDAHPDLRLANIVADDFADMHAAHAKNKGDDAEDVVAAEEEEGGAVRVVGNLLSFLLRLEDEYVKSLQRISLHTRAYVLRLQDEHQLNDVARGVAQYYIRAGDTAGAATAALLRLEHVYYKHDTFVAGVRDHAKAVEARDAAVAANASGGDTVDVPAVPDFTPPTAVVKQLAEFVYKFGDDRCRTRALLCHVAHHALHGRFYAARDLLLMSHLQETVHNADVETQILYNRATALLGLCAFREGLVAEAHSCLAELCSSRVKELLAQGMQNARFSDKNAEQEKAERRRQTPYHMHINLDLLECVHLTAAMLLEVPNMHMEQKGGPQLSRRPISRYFRKHMDMFTRQVFTGPPENTRDHILSAAKALAAGDWEKCCSLVTGLDVWALLPGVDSAAKIKSQIEARIKAEALRTYLFAFSPFFESLSLEHLCTTFQLEPNAAHGLVSKMMINRELPGSWDQPTSTIVLHRLQPTPLQQLALQYAEKAVQLVEANERLLDARGGGGGAARGDDRGGGKWDGGSRLCFKRSCHSFEKKAYCHFFRSASRPYAASRRVAAVARLGPLEGRRQGRRRVAGRRRQGLPGQGRPRRQGRPRWRLRRLPGPAPRAARDGGPWPGHGAAVVSRARRKGRRRAPANGVMDARA